MLKELFFKIHCKDTHYMKLLLRLCVNAKKRKGRAVSNQLFTDFSIVHYCFFDNPDGCSIYLFFLVHQ